MIGIVLITSLLINIWPLPRAQADMFLVTAYTSTGHLTSTGTVPHFGEIAVDPTVIPMGSEIKIEGFDNPFTAEDTGGGIKGKRVDIFMNSRSEAIDFGAQYLSVDILNSN